MCRFLTSVSLVLVLCGCGVDPRRSEQARQATQAEFEAKLQSGQEALEAKRYDDAITALSEAVRLMPTEPAAHRLLAQATDDKRQADYEQLMTAGGPSCGGDSIPGLDRIDTTGLCL